jgi:hypothetical protein
MKNIDISQIVEPTALQPFTANSLKFLQDYNSEDKAAIIKALVITNLGSYSLTVPYVISGCTVSDSGKDVTAGEIFYGGAFYETTAINGTTNIARFIKTKTQDAVADPLIFTDSSSKSVHDIYKYVGTDVASGGDFDSSDLVSVYGVGRITVDVKPANQVTTSNTYADLTLATYTTPNDGKTRTWLISASSTISFDPVIATTIGGKLNIFSGSILAESQFKIDVSTAFINSASGTVTVQRIVSIAPNTVVKAQILSLTSASGNINFNDNLFSMVEI